MLLFSLTPLACPSSCLLCYHTPGCKPQVKAEFPLEPCNIIQWEKYSNFDIYFILYSDAHTCTCTTKPTSFPTTNSPQAYTQTQPSLSTKKSYFTLVL